MNLLHREPEALIAAAKNDPLAREELIKLKEKAILKIASGACMKYVDRSDDEWSVALCAFSRAIDSYDSGRGDFMALASTLIRRDLIDYHRQETLHSPEVPVSPEAFDGNSEEEAPEVARTVAQRSMAASETGITEEISALGAVLEGFGFHFMDLTEASPRQTRTRQQCLKAASGIAADRLMLDGMMKSHHLPVSEIAARTGVPVKLLDKYRRYIITSAIILSEDYPHLAFYLKPVKGGQQK